MLPKHVADAIRFGIRHNWTLAKPDDNAWLGLELVDHVAQFLRNLNRRMTVN
ncbi:MAG: hypothetical protein AB8B50_13640 [Pirellulaceae bacterium]